jgi:hypothetical protein
MNSTGRRSGIAIVVLVGGLALGCAAAAAEETPAPAAAPCAAPSLSIEQLACMSWCELEQLYREASIGSVPCGFVHGRAIYCPGKKGSGFRNNATQCIWRGKIFDPCCASMINQWRGLRAIRARVYEGESWLDGKPSIILDYQGTSLVWRNVRDEIREVCPGVWLGVMYHRDCPCPKFGTFFALEAPCCGK